MENKAHSFSVNKGPKVSVVIPTYKRPQLLLRAIKSVLAQTEQSFEIIVVDDGSNDETASVVGLLQDSRIRFFAFPENRGGSAARNKGTQMAKGTYVAFLDSDDYWLPQKLEKQLILAQGLGASDWLIYNSLGNVRHDGRRIHKTGLFDPSCNDISTFLLREGNSLVSSGLFMLKSVALAYPFDESLRRFQDTDLVIRMVEGGVRLFLCDNPNVIWSDDGVHRVSRSTNSEYIVHWMNKMGGRISMSAQSYLIMNIARIEWNVSMMRSMRHWVSAFLHSPGMVMSYCGVYFWNHALGLIPVKMRRFLRRKIMSTVRVFLALALPKGDVSLGWKR